MDVTELNHAFRAVQSMIAETVATPKVDTARRDVLITAAGALDQELSRKLIVAGVSAAVDQYQAGLITLNELGQQFLLAYQK